MRTFVPVVALFTVVTGGLFASAAPLGAAADAIAAITGDITTPPLPDISPDIDIAIRAEPVNRISLQKREDKSLPTILVGVSTQLATISCKLNTLIASNIDVSVELVTPILDEVKCLLETAVTDIKYLIGASVETALVFEGKVLSTVEVGRIVGTLLCLLFDILLVVYFAVGVQLQVVAAIIANIGVNITAILQATVTLVPGIVVELTPLIKVIVPTIYIFGFGDLQAILHI